MKLFYHILKYAPYFVNRVTGNFKMQIYTKFCKIIHISQYFQPPYTLNALTNVLLL